MVTLDGIPEELSPVAKATERPRSQAAERQAAATRRRLLVTVDEEDLAEDDAEDAHALDDLA